MNLLFEGVEAIVHWSEAGVERDGSGGKKWAGREVPDMCGEDSSLNQLKVLNLSITAIADTIVDFLLRLL